MVENLVKILCALIQGGGALVAAIIAAKKAREIVNENYSLRYQSYSDKEHDIRTLLLSAQSEVYITAAVGDGLLNNYGLEFGYLLQRGIRIKYLMLTEERLIEAQRYIHGIPNFINESEIKVCKKKRETALKTLLELSKKYPELLRIRETNMLMPVSYVCIDPDDENKSVIQAMLYQYNIPSKDSPITYFRPDRDEKQFESTVKSLRQHWEIATDVKMEEPEE